MPFPLDIHISPMVSVKLSRLADRPLKLRHADRWLIAWHNRSGAPVVLALAWLGENIAQDPDIVKILRDRLSPNTKQDLMDGIKLMQDWMIPVISQICSGVETNNEEAE